MSQTWLCQGDGRDQQLYILNSGPNGGTLALFLNPVSSLVDIEEAILSPPLYYVILIGRIERAPRASYMLRRMKESGFERL